LQNSLQGLNILVTRPKGLCENLCQKIIAVGAIPHVLPLIEISPASNQAEFKKAIMQLAMMSYIIFISRTAVRFSLPIIKEYWPTLPTLHWFAIGAGTATELQRWGVGPIFHPPFPPFNSETLVEHPLLQNIKDKQIIIFRGNGGRDYLLNILTARQACITVTTAYERKAPDFLEEKFLQLKNKFNFNIMIVTSCEMLTYLMQYIKKCILHEVLRIPVVVVGARMKAYAHELGFIYIVESTGADDEALLFALTRGYQNIKN